MHELRQRLNYELDIVELIRSTRYSRVLSKIKLKKIQRSLIGSFKNYNMNSEKPFRVEKLRAKVAKKYDLDFSDLSPESDLIDRMILYQITGHRIPGQDYPFTLSDEDL